MGDDFQWMLSTQKATAYEHPPGTPAVWHLRITGDMGSEPTVRQIRSLVRRLIPGGCAMDLVFEVCNPKANSFGIVLVEVPAIKTKYWLN